MPSCGEPGFSKWSPASSRDGASSSISRLTRQPDYFPAAARRKQKSQRHRPNRKQSETAWNNSWRKNGLCRWPSASAGLESRSIRNSVLRSGRARRKRCRSCAPGRPGETESITTRLGVCPAVGDFQVRYLDDGIAGAAERSSGKILNVLVTDRDEHHIPSHDLPSECRAKFGTNRLYSLTSWERLTSPSCVDGLNGESV